MKKKLCFKYPNQLICKKKKHAHDRMGIRVDGALQE